MNKDTESQPTTTEEGGEKSPKQSLQVTNTSDVTKDTNDNQDKDQLKQANSSEGETIEVVRKSSQKPFIVTKISEEENCEEKVKDSFEKDPSTTEVIDIEDTNDETQSLLDKIEEEEVPEKKKKGVTLNVAPLATGEVDTESMPATPRDPTINSKEQVGVMSISSSESISTCKSRCLCWSGSPRRRR